MKGTILLFGTDKKLDSLECLCTANDYRIRKLSSAGELKEYFTMQDTVMILYDFHTKAVSETESLALLNELRELSNKPILALVDKDKEMLRILALNAGADSLLDGEDSAMESMARIEAQIRCYKRLSAGHETRCIKMKDLEMDDGAKLVLVKGNRVDLTPTEYKILHLLLETPGKVLSNKEIYEHIWKMEPIGAENTIAVHIRHIREKIEENPQEPRYLQVVWGQGYKVG